METVVEEGGMKFAMDFAAGYSAGLFIDQRANRAFLRRSRVERLLNTFSYTCSFSVAAALGGAVTTSVDLSKKSLDRGRENFALNGMDPVAGHRFYADDVLDLLPRFARKGDTFDAIVLDPPTFSRGNKGRRFQVEHDFEQLLLAALEVATPQCRILLSTNCTRLTRRSLESIARHCLKLFRRPARFHSEQPLPDVPSESGAQTLWVI
jgi:23S rRNA (cytosine1962-C5)-methyltransferase